MLEPECGQRKIDELIAGLGDWRGKRLAEVRELIHDALPGGKRDLEVDGKPGVGAGRDRRGQQCAQGQGVKLTIPRGAQLTDPDRLFNAALAGGSCRASSWGASPNRFAVSRPVAKWPCSRRPRRGTTPAGRGGRAAFRRASRCGVGGSHIGYVSKIITSAAPAATVAIERSAPEVAATRPAHNCLRGMVGCWRHSSWSLEPVFNEFGSATSTHRG